MARKSKESVISARSKHAPRVSVIMGSESDWAFMKEAVKVLDEFKIPHEARVVSAHRTPVEMFEFASLARERGIRVIIAGAGGAAHLPGMVASLSELPVIGVPVPNGALQGEDALLSIVQMPKGVPVATVAIGNAANAAILAIQILAAGGSRPDNALLDELLSFKEALRQKALRMKLDHSRKS